MPRRADSPGISMPPPAVPHLWRRAFGRFWLRGLLAKGAADWGAAVRGGLLSLMVPGRSHRSKRRKTGGSRLRASARREEADRRNEEKPLSRRWTGLVLIAVCGISVLVAALAFDSLPSIIGDNAEFVILARSMAAGNGFRYINHPDNRPATKYPVGFPALLAGWILVFGDSVVSMKVCVAACYVAGVALTFMLAKRLVGWTYAVVTSSLVAFSAVVVAYSHQVLSDVPYMLFSLAGIYLLVSGYRRRWYLIAGLGVCIWAYVVRSAGMSLVLAAVVFLFLKNRKKQALITVAAAVLISVLWSLRNYTMTGEGSRYMQVLLSANPYDPDMGMLTFSGFVSRVFINAGGYLGGLLPVNVLPTLIRPAPGGGGGALSILISVLVMFMVVLGGYGLRKKLLLTNIYLVAYFAVYMAWPEVWRSERFMVPIAPLMALYFIWGLKTLLAYFDVKKAAILLVCGALVASNLFSLSDYIRRERGYSPGWMKYLETAQWAKTNTEPGSVVMCRKPFLFNLFSDRKTIGYPFTRDKEAMRDYLLEARPDLIVLDDFGGGISTTDVYVVPVLQDMLEYLGLAYETGEPVNKILRFYVPQGIGER